MYTIACRRLSCRSPAAVVLRRAPDRRAGGWRRARGRCGCLLLRWPRQDTPTTLAELRAAQAVGVEVIAAAQCKTTPTVGSFTPQMASIGSMDLRLGALTPQISLAVAAEAAAASAISVPRRRSTVSDRTLLWRRCCLRAAGRAILRMSETWLRAARGCRAEHARLPGAECR